MSFHLWENLMAPSHTPRCCYINWAALLFLGLFSLASWRAGFYSECSWGYKCSPAGEWVVKLQRGLKQIKHNPLPPHTHTHTSSLTANTGLCLDIPERGAKLPLFSLFLCTHKTSTIYFSCYVTWWHLLAPQAPRLCLFFRLGWHRGHMPAYGPLAPRYWSLSQEQGSEVSCPQKQYTQ